MPTDIKLKNSVTATNAPTSLQQGEVAINITDKKVWVGNAATTPVLLLGSGADGTFTNLTVSGVASFADGTVSLPSITNIGDTNTGIFFPAADTIAFTEGGVESMRITSDGNVGFGTSSPHNNAAFTSLSIGGSKVGFIGLNNASGTMQATIDTFNNQFRIGTNGTSNPIIFNTGGSVEERMRIDSSGNVGIGTSSPNGSLTVSKQITALSGTGNTYGVHIYPTSTGQCFIDGLSNSSSNSSLGLRTYNNGTYTEFINNTQGNTTTFQTAGTERMRITSAGDVIVGKTVTTDSVVGGVLFANGKITGTMAASTSGTSTLEVYSTGASAYRFYVTMDGKIACTSTTIAAISDVRLKENIEDIDVGLNAVMALKPRKFDWKTGKGKNIKGDRGWIAQEFEQIFPEMISTWKDAPPEGEGSYKAVAADLIPVLVKAIQELKAELDSVKAELQTLKGA